METTLTGVATAEALARVAQTFCMIVSTHEWLPQLEVVHSVS